MTARTPPGVSILERENVDLSMTLHETCRKLNCIVIALSGLTRTHARTQYSSTGAEELLVREVLETCADTCSAPRDVSRLQVRDAGRKSRTTIRRRKVLISRKTDCPHPDLVYRNSGSEDASTAIVFTLLYHRAILRRPRTPHTT